MKYSILAYLALVCSTVLANSSPASPDKLDNQDNQELGGPTVGDSTKWEVVQLTEYCRHGARTAFAVFPNSTNATEVEKFGNGILTPNGHRMHYILGRQLRQNYPSIFNDSKPLTNFDMEVFASAVPRTQLSALSQLAGLYPFGTGANITVNDSRFLNPAYDHIDYVFKGNYSLPEAYRAFPLNIKSAELDFLFLPNDGKESCPGGYETNSVLRKKAYNKYKYLVGDLGDRLEEAGFSSKGLYNKLEWDIGSLGQLASEMLCYQNYYDRVHPDLPPDVWTRLERFQSFKFFMDYLDPRQLRLKGEVSARAILQGMENFVRGDPYKRKFRLFSGHDTGLYPHTIFFGLTDLECNLDMVQGITPKRRCEGAPKFASQFIYELLKNRNNGRFYVRVLYDSKPFQVCDTNEDDYYCEFDLFKKTYSKLMFEDPRVFIEVCGNRQRINAELTEDAWKLRETGSLAISLIGGGFCLVILSLIVWRCFKIKQSLEHEEELLLYGKRDEEVKRSLMEPMVEEPTKFEETQKL